MILHSPYKRLGGFVSFRLIMDMSGNVFAGVSVCDPTGLCEDVLKLRGLEGSDWIVIVVTKGKSQGGSSDVLSNM